jgi:hypothetical protein
MIPIEVGGNIVADPAGGVDTVPRDIVSDTEALDSKRAFVESFTILDGVTLPATVDNRIIEKVFQTRYDATLLPGLGLEGWRFDISNYYAGDIVAIRLELDAEGSPAQDLTLWQLVVEAVVFSVGDEIEGIR